MKILIPSPSYETVPDEVLESIKVQGIDPEIIDCTYNINIPKRKRIILAKTKCKEIGLSYNDEFVVLNDSDLKHIEKDNFILMQKFLKEHQDFGAISLLRTQMNLDGIVYNPNNEWHHICSGVIMFVRKALEIVSFGLRENWPTCFSIGQSLSQEKIKYGYVDSICRISTFERK